MIPNLTPAQEDLAKRAYEAGREWRHMTAKWDAEDVCDYKPVSDRIGELGFHGLTIAKEWGGKGGTCTDYVLAFSEIVRGGGSWIPGEALFCTTGPGPSMLLLSDNGALKEKFLRDVVGGKSGCAICLSEPDHASDLTHLESSATTTDDGFIINADKNYVTGAMHNNLYALFVRFDGIPGPRGIGAVIVESNMEGFYMEKGPTFMGTRGIPHGNVKCTNVKIPKENLIVGPGEFPRLMTAFNMERLHNATISFAYMQAAYDETVEWVKNRIVFGRPVIEFQASYHALADIAVTIEAARLMTLRAAATAIDGNYPRMKEVSMAKLFGGTRVPGVTQKCLELMGGVGVTKRTLTEIIARDAITNLVAGGAPAVLRNSIAQALFPDRKFPQTRGGGESVTRATPAAAQ